MEAQTMITTHSAQATRGLGQQIGGHLADGDAVCLSGELGAGKTHFIQGLAHGWGALEPVTSPTYTLLNTYTRQKDTQRFYHLDCYRLAGPEDAVTLAFDDILDAPGVLVI
ncbi:MAG: tRNA (adenosine(37)-N6)-threonylcarbamoyltransferase complex ATPase subunit type 1 TsaE, partial [Anaerolineae bacterium]